MSLHLIQQELKAPKGQYNSFGKYKYRKCEDILEAVKPILSKYQATITLSDDLVCIGDRYYVKATASIKVGDVVESVTAFAREELEKKGMDASQITGTASSYARKYALNGLLAIDDTDDADAINDHGKGSTVYLDLITELSKFTKKEQFDEFAMRDMSHISDTDKAKVRKAYAENLKRVNI